MTRSLSARLVLGLVALAALGLVVASVVTYSLLESSLTDRLDEQLLDSAPVATASIERRDGIPRRPNQRPRRPPPAAVPLGLVGLYAEVRSPDGDVVAATPVGVDDDLAVTPELPADLAPGAPTLSTVEAVDGTPYRVLTEELAGGEVLVVAAPLSEVEATLSRLVAIEVVVVGGVLAVLAVLAWGVVQTGLRPLRRVEGAAVAVAAGDLSQRVPDTDPRSEVGRLGSAFNTMVERIETSFAERDASEERLRRFLSDASHELRTPLTSIRGYAELFRRGAVDDPADLADSLRRIEEEAARMGVLVDDLLLLARLDQGRPLAAAPVRLDRIAEDACRDARAVSPEHPITADLEAVVVSGDEARLRQVVANLLTNATTHTPAGTAVRVGVAGVGPAAVLEVADDGPGLSAEQAATVFDRFSRVDDGRTRATGGAGLGLSIAAAIAEAHGGRITLRTSPGAGCTFRVELPSRPTT